MSRARNLRPIIMKTDLIRDSQPFLNYSMFTYGQPQPTPHSVLNMVYRPGMRNIRNDEIVSIPDVSETVPEPILAPDQGMSDKIYNYTIPEAPPYIPRAPPLISQTPPKVEEVENAMNIIDDNIDNMPIEDVIKINEKLDEGIPLNKTEEKMIAPLNSSLLEDIRRGIKLNKNTEISKPVKEGFSLQDALKAGLAKQRKGVDGDDGIEWGGALYNRRQIEQSKRINDYMNYINKFY